MGLWWKQQYTKAMGFAQKCLQKIQALWREQPVMFLKVLLTAVILVLLATVCIFSVHTANIGRDYTNVRNEVGEELYSNLYMMRNAFQGASRSGADIENGILPYMQKYYAVACALDDILSDSFGRKYSVLNNSLRASIDNAFSALNSAIKTGSSVEDSVNGMQACLNSLDSILTARYDEKTRLLPAK